MQKPRKARGSRVRRGVSASTVVADALGPQNQFAYSPAPELQLIYDAAPVGLAFLTTDCRYLQINQRLTEICGICVADHIGRSVRETVPRVADQVEEIVRTVVRTGRPVIGIEVHGQRADKLNADRVWITNWHPLKSPHGESVIGINVVAEDITDRRRAEAVLSASETALRETEGRFRELADNISQFAWTADQTGWRYWYNKRWYDYTGTTLKEMEGWGWQKVHHPDHVGRVVQGFRQSCESGTPWEDTFPLRGSDGNYRWFLSRALPIRNEAGDIIRWFGTNTDVTDQIMAERALRELNESLEQRVAAETRERLHIWNVSQDLLLVADLEGKYLSVNPAWTAALGWSESDLLGKPSQRLLHPDDRERTLDEVTNLAAGKKTVRFENRFRHKDGSYHWISWKAAPEGGRIYGVGRDVTELKQAEDKLREARRELVQVARRTTLAAMSGALAHEIKQPLGAIVANANAALRWLGRTPPNLDKAHETLTDIVTDGHRVSEVIQSVRAMFTHGDQAVMPLDVNGVIRDTMALMRGELEAAGISAQLGLAPQLSLVCAHKVQLQQVMLNIVANAADAMRAVTDRQRVLTIQSAPAEHGGVAVEVADSGTGIDPQSMAQIFDAFFTTKPNGMGMGLAICRSIVEAHGGTLSVSAGMPYGSVFRIVLPSEQ